MFSAKHTTDNNEHIVSLSYNPPPNADSVEHPPIDIHFVIDVSYSMDDIIPDPSELALPLYEKKTFSSFSIDPPL